MARIVCSPRGIRIKPLLYSILDANKRGKVPYPTALNSLFSHPWVLEGLPLGALPEGCEGGERSLGNTCLPAPAGVTLGRPRDLDRVF